MGFALLTLAALGLSGVGPAHGAPPASDSIGAPTVISSYPSTFEVDTSEATSTRTDGECVFGASVWYRFRPSTTVALRTVTIGSDYDTVLALFVGTRKNRTLVRCNDDLVEVASGFRYRFKAGQQYWIAISTCCSRSEPGGSAVLRMYRPAAAGFSSTLDSVETGGVSGRLIVSGTAHCDTPSSMTQTVMASQRVGTGVARGFGVDDFTCTQADATWSVVVDTETGWAFQPGQIMVGRVEEVGDGWSYLYSEVPDQVLTAVDNPLLRGGPR